MVLLAECLPFMQEVLGLISVLNKSGMVTHTCNHQNHNSRFSSVTQQIQAT